MGFAGRFTGFYLCLALVPTFITSTSATVSAAETTDKKPVANAPRQNWATTDGVVSMQPAKLIPSSSVADQMMIANAFGGWGIAYDEGLLEVVRSLFTDNGRLEVLKGSGKPIEVVEGADAIVAAVKRDRANQNDQRRHLISNTLVEKLSSDSATAIAYSVVTVASDNDLYLGASVIYRGDLKRQPDGTWRFERLVIGMDAYKRLTPASSAESK
ncbi:hypothetical protein CYK37_00100 [Mesorhizobium loti]|nr:nuclear transport factor 2 family protein [Mesorhizobium loti]PLP60760.1 hypothetical protein CYK37_00100 [Mesorhizobium loti]